MYMDDHNPPHFHVKYQEYEAIVTIEDGIVTGSLPRRALRLIYEWLACGLNWQCNFFKFGIPIFALKKDEYV